MNEINNVKNVSQLYVLYTIVTNLNEKYEILLFYSTLYSNFFEDDCPKKDHNFYKSSYRFKH